MNDFFLHRAFLLHKLLHQMFFSKIIFSTKCVSVVYRVGRSSTRKQKRLRYKSWTQPTTITVVIVVTEVTTMRNDLHDWPLGLPLNKQGASRNITFCKKSRHMAKWNSASPCRGYWVLLTALQSSTCKQPLQSSTPHWYSPAGLKEPYHSQQFKPKMPYLAFVSSELLLNHSCQIHKLKIKGPWNLNYSRTGNHDQSFLKL